MEDEFRSGFGLIYQQTVSLVRKNAILAWQNKFSTFLQLFSSFLFIAILFGVQKSRDHRAVKSSNLSDDVDDPIVNPTIPACEDKLFINLPCYDFVWSGDGNQRINRIVDDILKNNPDRPIPANKVKAFKTKDEMNQWLMGNPMRVPGALSFVETNEKEIRFGVSTNQTYIQIGRVIEDAILRFQTPLQLAASREVFRSLNGDPNFTCDVGIKEFPHPPQTPDDSTSLPLTNIFDLMFFYLIAMFGFIFVINSIVHEKELKLRQMMTIMGLYDTAYWCSWLVFEGIMSFISSLLILCFGAMFRIDLFKKNGAFVVFLLFLFFALSMVGFAFFISTLVSKSSSTPAVGFSIFLIGLVTMLFSIIFYSKAMKKEYRIIWSLFPPNPFSRGLQMLLDAAEKDDKFGLNWSNRANTCLSGINDPCYTINYFYTWLISIFVFWCVVALYFDNILPNDAGVRKHLLYFIMPSYWTGKADNRKEDTEFVGSSSTTDKDVLEEENSVKEAMILQTMNTDVAVQLRGLRKTYSKSLNFGCRRCCLCCFMFTCKTTKPFEAVKGLYMNFPKNQLFCLLGPNGTGKSTTISCLTGVTPVTHGDAIVYENSISTPNGISKIRRIMGVCPQFDSLWDVLSGRHHLELFGSIKGMPGTSHKSEAERLLEAVKMDHVADIGVGNYSGGMKRRISLAIALIGNPKLVILDEPTTGMDPITRRHVWNLIEKAKQGRTIILTTHSMMEAEILSDRIGIMAKGKLRCIGTSTMLKSRFGTGYNVKVIFSDKYSIDINKDHRNAVKTFFLQHLNVKPQEEKDSLLTFVLPNNGDELLADFFEKLESRYSEFGIMNVQLQLGTLEEVFLTIAKKAEEESTEERLTVLNLTSGVSLLVPSGAKYITIPGTISPENPQGLMVEITWKQDENGDLCISSYSPEKPVPPENSAALERGTVKGIVLES